ncbi:hypothetical protein LTR70_008447 [Exophiala xenobiotica]|uniref:Nucleotide-diphospho-sugar transferase n=1 Tax=Lithohypha guttulata TaxID=1690604 RepID=A0ABR0K128_9EURO|nr:hypothetical protein LTR24_008075 [Lithohypha guttulata]KAK5312014.1 hypothetical protein LTR70_008447 [Exophiala xenobiotica]
MSDLMMLKDKPASYASPLPPHRQKRTWMIVVALLSLCFILTSPFTHRATYAAHPLYGMNIDWHRYAYSQYATNQHYLCNSLMIFDSLEKQGSKADRMLFYPKTWDLAISSSTDRTSQLLVLARKQYKVKLRPVEMYTLKRQSKDDEETWDASINKLHAWNEGEYDRIIHLDSDITLLQNIDELFFLPLSRGSPIAMPRAYWKLDEPAAQGGGHKLTSLLIVLQPHAKEADALWDMAAGLDNTSYSSLQPNHLFDMELLNTRYFESALTIPHRPYALVTGEFRRPATTNHTRYLGNNDEQWDPHAALQEAKLVHFSDWPLPKPWIMWPNTLMREMQPECEFDTGTSRERGCEDRKVWKGLYDDFRRRRKEVCRLLSVPAPEWPPRPRPRPRQGNEEILQRGDVGGSP